MRGRVCRSAVSVLLLTASLVGCIRPQPQRPPVPVIDDARDARAVDPCALLGAEQLAAVGLGGVGTPAVGAEGPRCRWRSGGGDLEVTVWTGGGGLATLARNSEPTTTRVRLAGYPALETFTGRGEFCQYDVGVADGQVVMAALDAPAPDSCVTLQAVLSALIANLPPAAALAAPSRGPAR